MAIVGAKLALAGLICQANMQSGPEKQPSYCKRNTSLQYHSFDYDSNNQIRLQCSYILENDKISAFTTMFDGNSLVRRF